MTDSPCISCEWMTRKRIVVNPDGQVIPCCYFANNIFVSKQFGYPDKYESIDKYPLEYELVNYPLVSHETTQDPILNSYIENKQDLNIFNNDIEDILSHEWFQELYDSWNDENKISPICLKHCTIEDPFLPLNQIEVQEDEM
jgi:hypothetical protein